MADNHTQDLIQSGISAETWRKYTDQIHDEVKNITGEIFGINTKTEAIELRPRNWKDPIYYSTNVWRIVQITWVLRFTMMVVILHGRQCCQDLMNTKVAELTFHVSVRLLSSGRVKSSYIQVNYITKDVRLPWVYEPFYSLSLMV